MEWIYFLFFLLSLIFVILCRTIVGQVTAEPGLDGNVNSGGYWQKAFQEQEIARARALKQE